MKAVVIDSAGPESALRWADVPDPEVRSHEVLIRVKAAGVNRADLLQRRGLYPVPPGESSILGLECAGEVAAVGNLAEGLSVGDRVMALVGGGGYSEYAAVDHRMALGIPGKLSYAEAAAIPEAFYTAFLNLAETASLTRGERVLIHAGASGVGTAAIQVARMLGADVCATAGSEAKAALCRSLGADPAIRYRETNFADTLLAAGAGVDVVLDPVAGTNLADDLRVLRHGGRLVLIGLMGGARADIDAGHLLMKNLRILGSTLRSKPPAEKIRLTERLRREVLPRFDAGELRPVVDSLFDIRRAEAAHARMLRNENPGKIVLTVEA